MSSDLIIEEEERCPNCKHTTGGDDVCPNCGAILKPNDDYSSFGGDEEGSFDEEI